MVDIKIKRSGFRVSNSKVFISEHTFFRFVKKITNNLRNLRLRLTRIITQWDGVAWYIAEAFVAEGVFIREQAGSGVPKKIFF